MASTVQRSARGALLSALVLCLGACAATNRAPELQWLEGAQPRYPAAARAEGVEGHVVVEYDVSADGAVVTPRVVESVPPGVFDAAALRAIRSWRYRPFDDGGGARAVDGVRSRFDFRLGEAYPDL